MRFLQGLILAAALSACASAPGAPQSVSAAAPANSVQLIGPSGTRALDAAALAALPRATLSVTMHGTQHAFEGALLTDVLALVGAPSGERLRGGALANVVIVRARDGYSVVYALAETDAQFKRERIIVADRMDGAALPADDGPFRIVNEGDLRPARSARMVTAIELRQLGADRAHTR